MKNICLINGSLRGKKATSLAFLNALAIRLTDNEFKKTVMTVKAGVQGNYSVDTLKQMAFADAIVFVFPLYAYGLPGALMRLLEDYFHYVKENKESKKNAKVYIIINCGYPRAEKVCEEAIRVCQSFCNKVSLDFRFAVCIGTGPIVALTQNIPFLDGKLKKAYKKIVSDITDHNRNDLGNYFIRPILSEKIIAMIKHHFEKKMHMLTTD